MNETPPLASLADFAPPPGAVAEWLTAPDGALLRAVHWRPEGAVRGTVAVLGGRTEFIEKYYEVAGELLARGFAVAMLDWRGQGLSARLKRRRLRGHIRDFEQFDADFAVFVREVVAKLPQPWLALAHSMGGNIVLRWLHHGCVRAAVAEGLPLCAGAALSAPMLRLRMPAAAGLATRAMAFTGSAVGLGSRYIPMGSDAQTVANETFEKNIVTSDRARFERQVALVKAMPELGLASPTFGWLAAAIESMDKVTSPGFVERIKTPVVIAGAGRDALVDPAVAEEVAGRLPNGRYLDCPTSKHEILMESDDIRARFWQTFDELAAEVAPAVAA